jgi:iron complex outermembrane receptor protein
VAQGMPAALLPTYSESEISLVSGGNPGLEPEWATTNTAGVVFQPKFEAAILQDLQISIDWYRIEIANSVLFVSATDAVVNCYDRKFNPELRLDNVWCSMFGRDPVTGAISGAVDTYRNLAAQSTSGIDAQAQWSFPAGPGRLSVDWYVSWVDSFQIQSAPGVAADQFAGTVGGFAGSYPEWKWNLRLGYTVGGLQLGARWRYIDSMKDGGRALPDFQLAPTNVVVPHYDYFDLDASYHFRNRGHDGLVLRAGIQNVGDTDPPIFPSWSNANTDASQYDVLGRRFFVGLNYKF